MVRHAIGVLIGVALLAPADASAQHPPSVERTLRRAHERYLVARQARDVDALATIDGELRALLARRPFVGIGVVRDGGALLGLQPAVFEPERLAYDGKVLRDAHAIDARSPARRFTLFSTIFPKGEAYVDVPDVDAARTYLREFPDGPFAADVHRVLADFHDDLFKALTSGERLPDYKRACFGRYMTASPPERQAQDARRIALTHYRAVLTRRPADRAARQTMRALSLGTSVGWHFCAE